MAVLTACSNVPKPPGRPQKLAKQEAYLMAMKPFVGDSKGSVLLKKNCRIIVAQTCPEASDVFWEI